MKISERVTIEMSEEINLTRIVYECVQCESKITLEQLSIMIGTKCPSCGYRVLRKMRSPIVRKVKAR